jgi:hypothetical protein
LDPAGLRAWGREKIEIHRAVIVQASEFRTGDAVELGKTSTYIIFSISRPAEDVNLAIEAN